jgi:hypothetical protein
MKSAPSTHLARIAVSGSLWLLPLATTAVAQTPEAQAAAYLKEQWLSSGAPAVSMAVAYKGRIVFSTAVGFADLDNLVPANSSTVYNIGSVSKVMTATAVMQLVEQGRVGLAERSVQGPQPSLERLFQDVRAWPQPAGSPGPDAQQPVGPKERLRLSVGTPTEPRALGLPNCSASRRRR